MEDHDNQKADVARKGPRRLFEMASTGLPSWHMPARERVLQPLMHRKLSSFGTNLQEEVAGVKMKTILVAILLKLSISFDSNLSLCVELNFISSSLTHIPRKKSLGRGI